MAYGATKGGWLVSNIAVSCNVETFAVRLTALASQAAVPSKAPEGQWTLVRDAFALVNNILAANASAMPTTDEGLSGLNWDALFPQDQMAVELPAEGVAPATGVVQTAEPPEGDGWSANLVGGSLVLASADALAYCGLAHSQPATLQIDSGEVTWYIAKGEPLSTISRSMPDRAAAQPADEDLSGDERDWLKRAQVPPPAPPFLSITIRRGDDLVSDLVFDADGTPHDAREQVALEEPPAQNESFDELNTLLAMLARPYKVVPEPESACGSAQPETESARPAPPKSSDQRCRQCGATLRAGRKFCTQCGARMEQEPPRQQPASCARCGGPLRPGLRFCTQCGAPVALTPPRPEPTQPAACAGCGKPVQPGERFCRECGRPVAS